MVENIRLCKSVTIESSIEVKKCLEDIVKIPENNFKESKELDRKCLKTSPEKIAEYIKKIPEGTSKISKEMRLDMKKDNGRG